MIQNSAPTLALSDHEWSGKHGRVPAPQKQGSHDYCWLLKPSGHVTVVMVLFPSVWKLIFYICTLKEAGPWRAWRLNRADSAWLSLETYTVALSCGIPNAFMSLKKKHRERSRKRILVLFLQCWWHNKQPFNVLSRKTEPPGKQEGTEINIYQHSLPHVKY